MKASVLFAPAPKTKLKQQMKSIHDDTINRTETEGDFAALIGLDWGSETHALCLHDCATGQRETSILEHTPEAIARWADALQRRFPDGKIALCLEQAKGPLANPIEMTSDQTPDLAHRSVVERLKAVPGYVERFQRVFGTADFSIDHVAKAIATFERTVLSGNPKLCATCRADADEQARPTASSKRFSASFTLPRDF